MALKRTKYHPNGVKMIVLPKKITKITHRLGAWPPAAGSSDPRPRL